MWMTAGYTPDKIKYWKNEKNHTQRNTGIGGSGKGTLKHKTLRVNKNFNSVI